MITAPRGSHQPQTRFIVPAGRDAAMPPERSGTARDGVRLLVVSRAGLAHRHFRDLPGLLDAGDVLVVNTSATVAAAVSGRRRDGEPALVHFSGWFDAHQWIVEVRRAGNGGPDLGRAADDVLMLPGGVELTLEHAHPDPDAHPSRLWVARVRPATEPLPYLEAHGRPIAYRHLAEGLSLGDHQTVYADEPGSAEMPSAGRPFTAELLVRLMAAGVVVAPLTLHAGVSSPELHESPAPERYTVPPSTARLVTGALRTGNRVVAVGTTVVRALETVAAEGGMAGASGWTDLVLGPDRPVRIVTGLLTGLHAPESSHLLLLEAVVGPQLVQEAYAAAVEERYLWHEFGDSMLFLP